MTQYIFIDKKIKFSIQLFNRYKKKHSFVITCEICAENIDIDGIWVIPYVKLNISSSVGGGQL